VSLDFLSPVARDDTATARSPMERLAKAAGARFEVRDGWNVAVDYSSPPKETGWADVSHLRKFELQGEGVGAGFGTATRNSTAWLCPLTPTRALLVGGPPDAQPPPDGLDVTTCFAALTVLGPQARELIARFCAIDLRPQISPPGSFRPGSIARQPGMILVEAPDRFLLLFGWAVAEYMWTVVEDAGRQLGGVPIGLDALTAIGTTETEVTARA
jgi:glycine cleavage system aminomethyltransferase T